MTIIPYNRTSAVEYAKKWALKRNKAYYNFDNIGGDCTNFASQCIYAGSLVMNFTSQTGWYYRNVNDRTASWTGVEFLYDFLINNKSVGPFAHEATIDEIEVGDIVQLGNSNGHFYHSPVITAIFPKLLICAHSYDALDIPLNTFVYSTKRFIHIDGVRTW